MVDHWEKFLDLMVDSVFINSGRGCINCSGIWACRHTREIAEALAERLGRVAAAAARGSRSRAWPRSPCRASADAISQAIDADLQAPGVTDVTARHRDVPRVRQAGTRRLPAADGVHCDSPDAAAAQEGIHVPVRRRWSQCPQDKMLETIGPTLVCTAITDDAGRSGAS